jgi:Dolichyl-phosphate-mannose-protein mannosyltransferase
MFSVRTSSARSDLPILAASALAFAAIRIPLYTHPGLILGWNSDAALFGLMARAMRSGADFPLFFWGQPYLGTLTSMLAALFSEHAGPLAVRMAAAVQVFAAILFFRAALKRTYGEAPANLAALWLIAGPAFLFHFTIAAHSEQLFLIGAILFWYATRAPLTTARQWLALGVIAGLGMWIHQGVMFLIAGIGAALLIEKVRVRFLPLIAGALLGYTPALVAFLKHEPVLYARTTNSWSIPLVFGNLVETLTIDLWLLLADTSATGVAIATMILAFAAIGVRRAPRSRALVIALATIAFSAAFRIFSTYPYPGSVRYISPVLPFVYGAAALGIALWIRDGATRRIIAAAALLVIGPGLYIARINEARAVRAGWSERYLDWPGAFDPRPTLEQIRGYRVCYAEVWVAHKLEFLSEPTTRFIPVRTPHRTLRESLTLIDDPAPKCFVDNGGKVRRLDPAEERRWRELVRIRARKAGL